MKFLLFIIKCKHLELPCIELEMFLCVQANFDWGSFILFPVLFITLVLIFLYSLGKSRIDTQLLQNLELNLDRKLRLYLNWRNLMSKNTQQELIGKMRLMNFARNLIWYIYIFNDYIIIIITIISFFLKGWAQNPNRWIIRSIRKWSKHRMCTLYVIMFEF